MFGNADPNLRKPKIKLNLKGLLLEGALMKGQAIHDIAAECLIKNLLKIKYTNSREQFPIDVGNRLTNHVTNCRRILNIKFRELHESFIGP